MNKEIIVTDRQTMIDLMMKSVASGMQFQQETQYKMYPLKSIYFPYHKNRYFIGDKVVIENGELIVPKGNERTHEITYLEGTLNDSKHRLTFRNLFTNETEIIEL